MNNAVIIVAGGVGKRMGTDIPKQYLEIKNKPVIIHTIEKFLKFDPEIRLVIVINTDYLQIWDELIKKFPIQSKYQIVFGGKTRFHSVMNGLKMIDEESLVGIHDAVRPLISVETIKNIYKHAEIHGNAIPVIDVKETTRILTESGSKMLDRSLLKMVQTPQVFKYNILKNAYRTEYMSEFTDDASVVEHSGVGIHLVEGDNYNFKITSPEDFEIAKRIL